MMHRHQRRRRRGQRGVAILELAIVAPVLILLVMGMAEMGVGWVGGSRLESSTSTAARTGASSGSVVDADRNILLSLRASLPADLLANASRVVVFSSNANGDMAAACRTVTPGSGVGNGSAATGANRCNTYTGNQLRTVTTTTNLGASDDAWPPATRRDRLSGPPDYLGVLVITTQRSLTDTFWADRTLERHSVFRLQPDIDG